MTSAVEIFDVIIVGCGPAGIAAAIGFQNVPSLRFKLLEARDYVGGRVFTDRKTFGTNTPIDLGAQWLHHYRPENPLYKYYDVSNDIHFNNHFILLSTATPYFDIDGTRISYDKIQKAEIIYNQICSKIKQASSLKTDKSIYDVIKDDLNAYNDDSSLRRLLDVFFGILEQYEASNIDQLSAKSYLKADNGLDEYNLALPNGFGTFIEKLVQKHQLPVELNCIVNRIDTASSESVVRISTNDGRMFLCKYVLVTIPLGCLKARSIEFIPTLPSWKQHAIDMMGVGLSNKIFLQFPFVFWDPIWTSLVCTSPRFRFFLFRPQDRMIQVKLAARVAIEIEQNDDQETINELMSLLRTMFSEIQVPQPSRFLITKWNRDEFARGAYSNFSIGTDNQTLIDLAHECNVRIHWAGEHTNYNGTIGCVDSAFESGEREAKKLIEKLNSIERSKL